MYIAIASPYLQPPFLKNCDLKDCLIAEADSSETGGKSAFTGTREPELGAQGW